MDLSLNQNDEFVWDLYKEHIFKRTQGKEPTDKYENFTKRKESVDDYIDASKKLLTSMKQNGFDKKYPVPCNETGLLLNGAHRIACAAVLEIDVIVKIIKEEVRNPWDLNWFKEKEFEHNKIQYILDLYNQLKMIDI
jgi:hypothetical protein